MLCKTVLNFIVFVLMICCQAQNVIPVGTPSDSSFFGDSATNLGTNIGCIFQDKSGHFWYACNGDGVYRYDGKKLVHLTEEHGLLSNYVLKIEQDVNDILWFTTRDGVCSFNGVSFTDYTGIIENATFGKFTPKEGCLIFGTQLGLCHYDGKTFTRFTIHPDTCRPSAYDRKRPYSVYSTLLDRSGTIWFGTQEKGVCSFDGHTLKYYATDGLDKAAVRALFQDRSGQIWAGNNGAGLFKFNGSDFINFTETKGLSNPDFLKKLPGKEGTLARPWTINEDVNGHLWFGTMDAGVWKYDGSNLTNYSLKDGLPGLAIWTIFKDHNGELWFVVDGVALYQFNGESFVKYNFHLSD